jgi:hypothetical protein
MRISSILLLVLGIAMLAMGYDAYRSVSSGVSKIFTGAPTDRSLLLLVGGGVLTIAGLGGISRSSK